MIKILIVSFVVITAYWLGRQSVLSSRKKPENDNLNLRDNVIDIDTED